VDISAQGITIRPVSSRDDMEQLRHVRWRGYGKYFESPCQVLDSFDDQPNVVLLLAVSDDLGPVGTLRLLDSRIGRVEAEDFVSLPTVLSPNAFPVVEATRFSVPRQRRSRDVKALLWKAYYLYCLATDAATMLAWVRPAAARDYRRLLFASVGPCGVFSHPRLGNNSHETFILPVRSAADRYREVGHPLYPFFCLQEHPNITLPEMSY